MLRASAYTFLYNLTSQFQSIFILRLGATPLQLGITNSVAGAAATSIALPTGWLADRGGIRRILLWGAPFMVLSSLIFGLAFDWRVAILAMILLLLGSQLNRVACPMVCGTYLKNRQRATGRQLCDSFCSVAGLIAPLVAATIIAAFGGLNAEGIRPIFLLQALGFAMLFLYTGKFYFDTHRDSKNFSGFLENTREVLKSNSAVKSWMVFYFLYSSVYVLSQTYLSAFVTEVKMGNEFTVGGIITASMLLPILLSLPLGRAADIYGRKKVLYLTMPLYCLAILLLIYSQSFIMLMVCGVMLGFFTVSDVTQGTITADLVPAKLQGTWFGLLNICRGVATIIAPLVGGELWSAVGPEYVFFSIIVIQACMMIILWFLIPETLQKTTATT